MYSRTRIEGNDDAVKQYASQRKTCEKLSQVKNNALEPQASNYRCKMWTYALKIVMHHACVNITVKSLYVVWMLFFITRCKL